MGLIPRRSGWNVRLRTCLAMSIWETAALFCQLDIIFRYLKCLGYQVRYVRNITDVGHLEGMQIPMQG